MIRNLTMLAFLALLVPGISFSGTNDKQQLVKRVIDASGIEQMFETFPEQIRAQIERRKQISKTPELEESVGKILSANFDIAQAKRDLVTFVDRNASQQDLDAILKWIDSPLGKRLSAAETDASKTESREKLMQFFSELQQTPPNEDRVGIVHDFVESSRQIESSINAIEFMMRGLASSMKEFSPTADAYTDEKINKQVEDMRPAVKEMLLEQLIVTGLYTYRDFSDDEIKQYIAFLNSAPGKRYIDLSVLSFTSILTDYLKRLSPVLKQEGEKQRAKDKGPDAVTTSEIN